MRVLGVPTLHAAENPQIIYSHFLYILCGSFCIYYDSASAESTNCVVFTVKKNLWSEPMHFKLVLLKNQCIMS